MRNRSIYFLAFALFSSTTLFADFEYQQTTKITGGFVASMARFGGKQATEPTVSTEAVKGNRMARISARTAQIIDLDKEAITHIDFDKKTYSVMTFAEMKQMMQDAMQRMQGKNTDSDPSKADISFKASVKQTGKTKDLNGVNAQE